MLQDLARRGLLAGYTLALLFLFVFGTIESYREDAPDLGPPDPFSLSSEVDFFAVLPKRWVTETLHVHLRSHDPLDGGSAAFVGTAPDVIRLADRHLPAGSGHIAVLPEVALARIATVGARAPPVY